MIVWRGGREMLVAGQSVVWEGVEGCVGSGLWVVWRCVEVCVWEWVEGCNLCGDGFRVEWEWIVGFIV